MNPISLYGKEYYYLEKLFTKDQFFNKSYKRESSNNYNLSEKEIENLSFFNYLYVEALEKN